MSAWLALAWSVARRVGVGRSGESGAVDKRGTPTDLLFRAGIEQTLNFFFPEIFSTKIHSAGKRKKVRLPREG